MSRAFTQLLLVAGLFGAANAAEYHLQLGAEADPSPGFYQVAKDYGPLVTTRGADGLTRFLVGPYDNEDEARRTLAKLRNGGFADAFLVAGMDTSRSWKPAAATAVARSADHRSTTTVGSPMSDDDVALLASLSAEDRAKTVYLDGRLHIKDGNRFTPIEEYLRNES